MKKGLLIASIASVTAVAGGLAFAVANANKGIRFEAVKADPETADIKFDKNHHGLGETSVDYSGTTFWREYDAPSTNEGGFSASKVQVKNAKNNASFDFEPADDYFTFTSGLNAEVLIQLEVAGATTCSWNVSYTGLDEDNKGHIQLSYHGAGWGYGGTFHSSALLNNGEHDIDISTLPSPYYLKLSVYDLPEDAIITINSFTVSYSISDCKTARGL